MVKSLPAVQETQVLSLGWEDPLEKEMATHSSILAWKIPWMEEPGRLQSVGSQRVDTTKRLHFLGIFHSMDAPWASQVAEWYRIRLPVQAMQGTRVQSPGGGNGNPLQYSCLGSSMDRGAWRATSMGLQRVRPD